MNTPEVNTQGKPRTAHQNIGKFKEEWEMKTATLTAKVNRWLHEHLAMKTPVKLLGGLALGALVVTATALPLGTTYADEPARPLSSEQIQCYPEDMVDCLYGPFLADVVADPALTTGTSVSGIQFEEWPEAGFDSYTYHRFMVEQGKVASSSAIDLNEWWPGVGLDSYTYHRFVVEQGKVGSHFPGAKVDAEIDDVEAMVIYGYSASIFHALNQGKVDSPSSINGVDEVWTEIEDTPVFHLMNQLKAGSPPSINGIRCYPEDNC